MAKFNTVDELVKPLGSCFMVPFQRVLLRETLALVQLVITFNDTLDKEISPATRLS